MGEKRADGELLDDLLAAIAELESMMSERDAREDFNIFEVVGIVNAEIRHSNTIAWLMDPNGRHGLGGKVLAGLIEHAGGIPPEELGGFTIRREADNIDILAVSSGERMTLAIENKVWSGEHDDQLGRYRRIVERKYRGWEHLYLYLTPNDDPPESDEDAAVWETLGYGDLALIVEDAMDGAELTPKARILIGDYLECVGRHIVGDEELSERCVQIYAEHKRALDLIMSKLPDARLDYASHRCELRRLDARAAVSSLLEHGEDRDGALEALRALRDGGDHLGRNFALAGHGSSFRGAPVRGRAADLSE